MQQKANVREKKQIIMKKVAILGSTGSIGTQALDVIERNREEFKASVLSCAKKIWLLEEQIESRKDHSFCQQGNARCGRRAHNEDGS